MSEFWIERGYAQLDGVISWALAFALGTTIIIGKPLLAYMRRWTGDFVVTRFPPEHPREELLSGWRGFLQPFRRTVRRVCGFTALFVFMLAIGSWMYGRTWPYHVIGWTSLLLTFALLGWAFHEKRPEEDFASMKYAKIVKLMDRLSVAGALVWWLLLFGFYAKFLYHDLPASAAKLPPSTLPTTQISSLK